MKYHRIKCEIYKAEGKTWERMAEELLLSAVRRERVVRLIFFTACKDNQEYRQQRTFLEQWADSHFPSPRPVVSVVAQKPLEGELVLEVHSLPLSVDEAVTLEERFASSVRYLRITSADYREIIAGGLCADDLNLPIREQSEQTFRKVEEILKAEQMNFGDIVRHVEILRQILRTEQFPVFTEGSVRHGPVVICRSTQQTAGTVKAAVPWVGSPNFSKMPFPGKIGTVSRFFQKFRQGGDTRVQASAVAGAPAVVIQEPYVHLVRFAAGHDGGPGG